ncbi:MAG: hypothetical protein H3C64_14935 [Candidatus Kuenenia stuttgartiensis]|uniref:Uncharacterized protein n=1 Tax=Kuenenia stuttgartiensis TaxID=174633 RepID=A0A2C9CMF8_KUEST|nr:hypothetical protein [Candidatus Kuenenia stuttgartiensis]MBW7943637.1 hypothetical protein [Candidatus Kuenenia stuttgartiensis]MBZ0192760.1 hypothetical protein [Candidatus Kuenenia stuttgartiensis]SOH05977.1 hypothetical protein KSMBR1_3503 [Candidatus Kuenenia stuttgartiensis]
MKLKKRGSCFKSCFRVLPLIPLLCLALCQTSLFGAVVPGVYKVTIKADKIKIAEDTWTLSRSGEFTGEALGIKSEWEDTGNNTFKIKTDKQEVIDGIMKNFYLIGLNDSDFSISIKKMTITGTSNGNTIKGDIKTNFRIKIKDPVKTTLNTNGSVSFKGEQ